MKGKQKKVQTHRVRVFKDKSGEWRWHRISGNNRIVATGAESYTRRIDALNMARTVNKNATLKVIS